MKVVFLGCTDNYGYEFSANVTKIGYMAKGLKEAGADCYIHNGICGNRKVNKDEIKIVDDIPVTSLKKRGHEIFSWVFNVRKVYKYLKGIKNKKEENIAIIELEMFHILFIYYIMCMFIGYKFVILSHEWCPTVVEINRYKRPSFMLYTKTFGWFADGILPISEYIIERIKHFKKPYYKLPILAEFTNHNNENSNINRNSLVYCASVYYKRIIMMIINAYKLYHDTNGKLKLTLILNGPQDRLDDIQEEINKRQMREYVIIKTKLTYDELFNEYATSAGLIIPLDPNSEQDEARFSQKIAEYLSSKSPIITNNVGEIKYYFTDEEVIKCDYNEESFAVTFKWVEENIEKSKEIGIKGYKKGLKEFDYKSNGINLYRFFKSI